MPAPHRIDTQHHILPPRYVTEVGPEAIGRTLVSGQTPDWTPEHSLAAMDRHGIATAVVSVSAPGFPVPDPAALCRYCNDYAAEMVARYPGRFGSFASLPLPDVDASLSEISRALDQLGADGICLLTSYDGRYLGDPLFAPIMDELERREAMVYVHPNEAPGSFLGGLPPASLEFPFDTTRAIANLLFTGTLLRTRSVKYIFSHAGGAVPFLAERLARLERRPDLKQHAPDGVLSELRRLHFDVALSAGELTLGALLRFTTPDRVLFASDFPHAPEPAMAGSVDGLAKAGLAPPDLALIERGNALRLMPRLR
ncbi:amidohydrolase family protein [Enterovirga aerilata]|uniref:Amidohydrolase n=1 Tax=Enterovirga aerilata TaxID=2730920 RepID=A0A849IMK3_9HYPH|nr:amidohydrolase family protein [Enterovirga sp. DB1703]NNM75173.1 amidohydrolase [Enterovirga sp. DB1703]